MNNQNAEPVLSCEFCGIVDFAYNFKRSKRFCSTVCAKRYGDSSVAYTLSLCIITCLYVCFSLFFFSTRYNVGCTKRMGLFPGKSTTENPKKQKASNANHHNSSTDVRKRVIAISSCLLLGLSMQKCAHSSHLCSVIESKCSNNHGSIFVIPTPLSSKPR